MSCWRRSVGSVTGIPPRRRRRRLRRSVAGAARLGDQADGSCTTDRMFPSGSLGPRLAVAHALGGAPEVSMIGRSSTPPPGAGHYLAKARAWSRSAASIR